MLTVLIYGFLFSSCENKSEELTFKNVNSLSTYEEFGRIHNMFLDAAVRYNQEHETRIIGDDEAKPSYENLYNQVMAQATAMDIEPIYKETFINSIQESKPIFDTDYMYETYFKRINGKRKIQEDLKEYWLNGTLEGFEYQLISNVCSIIASYHTGTSSYELALNQLDDCYRNWEEHYGPMLEPAGQMSGYILSITKSSMEWWDENLEGTRVAHWVYADAGGAIIGAVWAMGVQYWRNKKITDWKDVGYGALGGAIDGSVGVSKKLSYVIKRLI